MHPKNFHKSTRARGIHLDAIKHTIFQTIQISYSLQPGVIHTNCFSAAPCSFDLQTMVSCYNFNLDKDLYPRWFQNCHLQSWFWYTNCCIPFYISAPYKEINFSIFCSTIVNIVFSFIHISTLCMYDMINISNNI